MQNINPITIKKIIVSLILFLFIITNSIGQQKENHSYISDSTNFEQIKDLKLEIEDIQEKYKELQKENSYVLENYKIQNTTILYVATILGILLTIVIVYFGWRAQRVENEYERAKSDRERIKGQFDTFFRELSEKKELLNTTLQQINQIKTDIETQKENLSRIIENFILTYTKEYIESNKDEIFKGSEQEKNADENIISDQVSQLSEQIELLERLQHESTPEFDYKKIDIYFKTKNYNKVIELIEELLKKDKFNKRYYFHYAYSLTETGDKKNALKYYLKHLEEYKNNAGALNNIGLIYKSEDNIQNAIDCFKKAIEQNTKNLYFKNLLTCFSTNEEKLKLFNEYSETFENLEDGNEEKKSFKAGYLGFIEHNLLIDELFEYHKNEYQKEDKVTTFLNLMEASIIAREEATFNELITKKDSYKLNSSYKLILNLLVALNNCICGADCKNEFSNIDIISQDKSAFSTSWRFNLIDGILEKLPDSNQKEKIIEVIEKFKENK